MHEPVARHEEDRMQVLRSTPIVALVAVFVVACGGSPAATQGPGGGGGGTQAPQATDTPVATQSGGGGGGGGGGVKPPGWDSRGKASFEISGPVSVSGELGFLPLASVFGGTAQTYLTFTVEGTQEVFAIVVANDTVAATYTSTEYTASATTCTSTNLKIEGTTASGSIDCSDVAIMQFSGGTTTTDGRVRATFDAH